MAINHTPSSATDRIAEAAHKLALRFTENADLPTRYKKQSGSSSKSRKGKEDSEIEKRFKATVEIWSRVIETMLAKIENDQAWRFITLHPRLSNKISKITDSEEFCDFVDYMILRRDKEECLPDELGSLAALSVAFQREVEKFIKK